METEKHTDDGFVLRRRSPSTERNSGSVSDSQTDRQTDTHITVLRSPKHEHFARIYPISRRFKIGLCLRPQNIGVCSLFVSHYQTVNAVFVVEVHGLRQRLTYNGTTGLLLILFSSVLAFLD